jgi:hypothetical protein
MTNGVIHSSGYILLCIAASTAAADYLKLMQIAITSRDRQQFRTPSVSLLASGYKIKLANGTSKLLFSQDLG